MKINENIYKYGVCFDIWEMFVGSILQNLEPPRAAHEVEDSLLVLVRYILALPEMAIGWIV